MEDFESKNILSSEKINEKENGNKEYKSDFTKLYEQKAEEARKTIKELNEKFKKIAKKSEEVEKNSDESSS